MTATAIKPAPAEYASYYEKYVSLVPEGDIIQTLEQQGADTAALLRSISEDKAMFRYAPGKWSVKELVGHVIDTERIFAYRALRFGRNDANVLPGFEQEGYITAANFDRLPLSSLIEDFETLRKSTLGLLRTFDDSAWARHGVASENEVTVRALAHIMAGHELHHMEILRERYLQS